MNIEIKIRNKGAQIRNVFSDDEFEIIEVLAQEHGIETEWTNEGKPYMVLHAVNDTEVYIPEESHENIAHKIRHDLTADSWHRYGVESWKYETKDGQFDWVIDPEFNTNSESYQRFEEAQFDLAQRLEDS